MKKIIKIKLVMIAVAIASIYLIFSFVKADINFENWSESSRVSCAIIFVFVMIAVTITSKEVLED